jgi:type II secretory ATPase GspE/PulE/Tfp pilus assembly ATPase PilB-like protein
MAPKKRIGDIMIEQGLITQEQLEIGIQEQKKSGELLGSVLFSLGFISQKDLFKLLTISSANQEETELRKYNAAVPLEIENLVKQSSSLFQRDGSIGKKELDSAYSPLVNLVEKIIVDGVQRGATDIHINPDVKGVRIRYRVDGVLQHSMFLPNELLSPIVSRFKVMGQMNIAESRIPQDGSAEFPYRNRKLDLRISTFPILGGENIVVRVLDKSQLRIGLENLGFFEEDIEKLNVSIQLPFGMILVTGPTGSGKTTTLYSCLSIINTVSRNIITLEDPVEYQLPLARQCQINVKAGLTFASGLKSILRQDPDVILVGEMRDAETAELAIRASLTGHLVFSTIHTNDAISSIARIVDIGIDPFLISTTIDSIVAQRLVRSLCEECKEVLPPFSQQYKKLGIDPAEGKLYKSKGCPACDNSGFKGRSVIYEILKITPKIREMINNKTGLEDIRLHAKSEGFREMHEIALEKVRRGITTLDEISHATRMTF